ncbi:hypothetical protein QAD02_006954 [Eretmocerus hayati]|uniref:Uncharacterized protein n=1 Tax=Eretmocerus hayati TaxID=131215 RepID=A0ACC2N4M2_9HYME|nr:hypothetical protein QAD02_006954 [Eretmocerus hayati]
MQILEPERELTPNPRSVINPTNKYRGSEETDDGSSIISRNRRFSGGYRMSVARHPTVVQVIYHEQRACDGTILSQHFILTVAHCVMEFWHERIIVLIHSDTGSFVHHVPNVEYHKNYNPRNVINDIAILKLEDPILQDEGISFTKLAKDFWRLPDDRRVLSYKWSEDRKDDDYNLLLASVDNLLSIDECAKFFRKPIESLNGLLCARARTDEDKVIHQMSGGPVMYDGYQVGIVIVENYSDQQLVHYTNVTAFIDWIDATKSSLLKSTKPGTAFYDLPQEELAYNTKYGGEPTNLETSTFTVSIVNAKNGKLMCVGSVVSNNMVLTTARCIRKGYTNMRVRVHSKNYLKGYKEHTISKAYVHQDFDPKSYPHIHDVSLVRISTDFNYNKGVQEIEIIPRGSKIETHEPYWVYGFAGGLDLRRFSSHVIPKDECEWLYRNTGGVKDGMICLKSFHGWCNHVAGEPLIIKNRTLAGIMTATSQECADFRDPAIFIDIAANSDWINKKLAYLDEREEGL